MKYMKISKRDIKVFLLGMLVTFALLTVLDWKNNWAEFQKGFNAGYSDTKPN